MNEYFASGTTVLLVGIVAVSFLQGIWRGASGSAAGLVAFAGGTLFTLGSLALAAWASAYASPHVYGWLAARDWQRPLPEASFASQLIYTLATGLRDLPLTRFAVLFLLAYLPIRAAVGFIGGLIVKIGVLPLRLLPSGGLFGRAAGGILGAALGAARAMLAAVLLYGYCALFPQGPFTDDIERSEAYRWLADRIIRPAAGQVLDTRLPVLTGALREELRELWQRRYEVIDAEIPPDAAEAALAITAGLEGDEAKARALYRWVGTRIAYDHAKARAWEERGEWR
ncbi:MAG: cysteine protease, partial [Paenibacillaceae bacterium ZCTH02-B3]